MQENSIPPSNESTAATPSQMDVDEGVLNDVLEQLGKERVKRAEVEAELYDFKTKVEEQRLNPLSNRKDEQDDNSRYLLSQQQLGQFHDLDDADRIHKINSLLAEFDSIEDIKKRNKRTLPPLLTKLYTELQDTVLKGVSFDTINENSRETRIKDEVGKVMIAYNKQFSYGRGFKFDSTSIDSLQQILCNNTTEFVTSVKRLCSIEKMKEMENQMEQMRNELITLRCENEGYLEIISALTPNNDAILLCDDEGISNSLPLHTVQLLEIMPWDERFKSIVQENDVFYQWQVYDTKNKTWIDNNSISSSTSSEESTSLPISTKLAKKKAFEYPTLPTNGIWEAIGNWKVDGVPHNTPYDDEMGWTYSINPEYIKANLEDKCFNSAFEKDSGIDCPKASEILPLRKYRRRVWNRQRVLKSYPGISRETKQLLELIGQNAKLSYTVGKLHDQVYHMQNELTDKEENMDKTTMDLLSQLSILELEKNKNANERRKEKVECNKLGTEAMDGKSAKKESKKSIFNLMENPKEFLTPIKSLDSNDDNSRPLCSPSQDKKTPSFFVKLGRNWDTNPDNIKKHDATPNEVSHNKKDDDIKSIETEVVSCDSRISAPVPKISLLALKDGSSDKDTIASLQSEISKSIPQSKQFEGEDDIVFLVENEQTCESIAHDIVSTDSNDGKGNDNESKILQASESFAWRKLNPEAIFSKVKSKVKDVETSVLNVKSNVQAVAERAHTFQKIASHVK